MRTFACVVSALALALLSASTTCAGSLRAPATPIWAPTWQAPFDEYAGIVSFGNTTGYFWYDYNNGFARTDRASGKHDRYCGSVKSQDTPCTHLVRNGTRYLNFPEIDFCCACCNEAKGCGLVVPNWISNSNGSYVGRVTTSRGIEADKWLVKGLQSNYWYQTPAGAAVELDQDPDDYQYFDPTKYNTAPIDAATFDLPSQQCNNKCPLLSICTLA